MKKKVLALLSAATLAAALLTGCGKSADDKTIKVAATAVPHAEILEQAKPILEKQGYTLEIQVFQDYVQPNEVVESGDFDANYFQHIPYLESFNKEKGTHLVNAGGIHYEPFGIFPGKTKTLKALKNGATVAVLGGELGDTFDQIADYVYSMDKGWNDMQYSAIIGFIGQLLGYYIAESKNLDADSPRHLTQAIVLK